jgi:hypothetical protein
VARRLVVTREVVDPETVLRIARAVALRYKRRCWWADVDDLTSEASVAVLRAARTWDPQVGVPFEGYAGRAAVLGVRAFLWRESAPVSGGQSDPRANLTGVRRVELGDDLAVESSTPAQIDTVRWRLAVRDRIRSLAQQSKGGDAAYEVVGRDRTPSDVQREHPEVRVYSAVEVLRRKVRDDYKLYDLWKHES